MSEFVSTYRSSKTQFMVWTQLCTTKRVFSMHRTNLWLQTAGSMRRLHSADRNWYGHAVVGYCPQLGRLCHNPQSEGVSGRAQVPVIVDKNNDGKWVNDSFKIAKYLEATYPDRPTLFGGPSGEHWRLRSHVAVYGMLVSV